MAYYAQIRLDSSIRVVALCNESPHLLQQRHLQTRQPLAGAGVSDPAPACADPAGERSVACAVCAVLTWLAAPASGPWPAPASSCAAAAKRSWAAVDVPRSAAALSSAPTLVGTFVPGPAPGASAHGAADVHALARAPVRAGVPARRGVRERTSAIVVCGECTSADELAALRACTL